MATVNDINTDEDVTDGETGCTFEVSGFGTITGLKIKSGTYELDATNVAEDP